MAGEKILLIDDNRFFLQILQDAFSQSGFVVVTANDGASAVQAFQEHQPDAVISDLVMPGKGGVSTCLEISSLAGDRDPVLVLLTSMFKGAPHEHESAEMGAKIHIPKSTPPLDIVIIVEQLLERKRYRIP
ncbi:response regulator [Geomesophilobacter sediminis]|uniref:Response regulator n=1 Tax=Geomesophilobacter sediminis TaxID=2798584 RepID=A0A8J7IMW9_9BACT|nr:response regulator [Geomesophilobacter sediminis]MBJ6723214.1 response regulator [Geomesophilobacter sediminis]